MLSVESIDDHTWAIVNRAAPSMYLGMLTKCKAGYQFIIARVQDGPIKDPYPTLLNEIYSHQFYSSAYPRVLVSEIIELYTHEHDPDQPFRTATHFGGTIQGRPVKMFSEGDYNA